MIKISVSNHLKQPSKRDCALYAMANAILNNNVIKCKHMIYPDGGSDSGQMIEIAKKHGLQLQPIYYSINTKYTLVDSDLFYSWDMFKNLNTMEKQSVIPMLAGKVGPNCEHMFCINYYPGYNAFSIVDSCMNNVLVTDHLDQILKEYDIYELWVVLDQEGKGQFIINMDYENHCTDTLRYLASNN